MLRVEDKDWSDLVYWRVFHEWTRRAKYFWGESNDPRFSLTRILSTVNWARHALSIGCGTGAVEYFLPTNMEVVGIDEDVGKLRLAWGLCPWTMFMRSAATRLPFRDDLFNLVLAVSVIEFVDDKAGLLDEMWRVMRPGGYGIICTPNGEHPNYSEMDGKMTNAELVPLLQRFVYLKWKMITWKDEEDDRFIFYHLRKPTENAFSV